jgi:hypothetical protein
MLSDQSQKQAEGIPQDEIAKVVLRVILGFLGCLVAGFVLGILYLRTRRYQLRIETSFAPELKSVPLVIGAITTSLLLLSEGGLFTVIGGKPVMVSFFVSAVLCTTFAVMLGFSHWKKETIGMLWSNRRTQFLVCFVLLYLLLCVSIGPIYWVSFSYVASRLTIDGRVVLIRRPSILCS